MPRGNMAPTNPQLHSVAAKRHGCLVQLALRELVALRLQELKVLQLLDLTDLFGLPSSWRRTTSGWCRNTLLMYYVLDAEQHWLAMFGVSGSVASHLRILLRTL